MNTPVSLKLLIFFLHYQLKVAVGLFGHSQQAGVATEIDRFKAPKGFVIIKLGLLSYV